ncbi:MULTISPECIES: hypothetical protein [unclassified Chryseobacterium]|uniref:hypothetical protein n=1 Tax=unclassified Chryseobacterium TaxID=2593645 RepID=UPI000F504F2E|nr:MULTISPECIES: hypothetical protein [unclassified Chryseobacterium]
MHKKLFFIFLFIPFMIVLMNMIRPVISSIKKEIYERTQYHILNHKFDESETVYFSEKDLLKAEWKEEKEFTLNGFSYDIIKVDHKNGEKYYHCYFDKKDIVIHSILKFSGFFVTKKIYAWRYFNSPFQHKKIIKTSSFFTFFEAENLHLFTFYFRSTSDYLKRLENTYYLSVIIPPPEERFKSS